MKTMYHITFGKNLMKIRKNGFLKPKRPIWDYINLSNLTKYPKAVYLSRSPYWFKSAFHEKLLPTSFNDLVILEINVNGLKLKRDLRYPSSFFTSEKIPWSRVKNTFYIGDKHLEMTLKIVPQKIY